jgi:UrcA family protein
MRAHTPRLNRPLGAALALAAAFAVAAPAAAQIYDPATDSYSPVAGYDAQGPYVDELVVTGPIGPDGPRRLSRAVGLADLDLVRGEDRALLRIRVRDTARDLCRALGEEASGPSPLIPSCEQQAIRDARPQVRVAIDQAYARARYAALDARDPYAPYPY